MGFISWIKKIFSPSEDFKDSSSIKESKIKEKKIKKAKPLPKASTIPVFDWFKIAIVSKTKIDVNIFAPRTNLKVLSLESLRQARLQRELEKIALLREQADNLRISIDKAILSKKLSEAESQISKLCNIQKTLNDSDIQGYLSHANSALIPIREEIKKREEERKQKERERLERERAERLERERRIREQEEKKRRIEQEEREKKKSEYQKLVDNITQSKSDSIQIARILESNNVIYLYHFTARDNIKSIKEQGGLFSWQYCQKHGISIPKQGGDQLSKSLDTRYGLQDYVRLSFCDDHPMAYHCHKRLSQDIVLLKIRINVALFKDTLFSDINAADSNHSKGETADFLRSNVNFNATKRHRVRKDDPEFGQHQAEVLVKTHVPIEFITNIEFPQTMIFK